MRKHYRLDIRALALMRIGVGLVVLSDLIVRSGSMVAHYTDEGVLPIKVLQEFYPKVFSFSFHNLNGELWWQVVLFFINALVAIGLIVGYRTRLFSVLAWTLMVSLHNHNPFIQQSGDDLLRMTLLFGMFMPWGNFYSIDSKTASCRDRYVFSLAAFGYMLLVACVYTFSAIYKTSPEWRSEGTAVYYALSLDQVKIGLGHWLYQYPSLMKLATHMVYFTEILIGFLIIMPFRNSVLRSTAVVLIIFLHIAICLNLYVGFFYIIGIVTAFGLFSSKWMDKLEKNVFKIKSITSASYYRIKNLNRGGKVFAYAVNILLIFVITISMVKNLSYVKGFPYRVSSELEPVLNFLKLEQFWGMFSPTILKDDGWFVYRGLKKDGVWDIYNNKPQIVKQKPEAIVDMYKSDRWRKFAENYQRNEYNFMRPYYCRYLIRKWNKEHPDNRIDGLNILFLKEVSLPAYQTKDIVEENVCLCYENEPK